MNRKNHYHTLGIEKNATNNEIRSAYRKLAHQFHPDHNHQENAPQMFIEIKEAYDTLIDENKRAKYDLQEPLATSYQTNNNYENENDLKAEDLHNDAYDFNSEPEEEAIVQHGLTILKIIPWDEEIISRNIELSRHYDLEKRFLYLTQEVGFCYKIIANHTEDDILNKGEIMLIGINARILKNAIVTGNVLVYENATVTDNAYIRGGSRIFGHAKIEGHATILNEAHIFDNAIIGGQATIRGDSWIFNNAKISEQAMIVDSYIYNQAQIADSVCVNNESHVFGDLIIKGYTLITNKSHLFGKGIIDTRDTFDHTLYCNDK